MSGTINFDHHSETANADPVAYYAEFREKCPVGRTEAHGGFWYTTRYEDVVRIARDDETFSSSRELTPVNGTAIVIPQSPAIDKYPLELDPPRSTEYRELINPLLTLEAVDKLRPMIARHAARVVDTFIGFGSCDLVRDLTNPLPAAVTLDWLGFPEEDWEKLAAPIHDIFATVPGSERSLRGAAGLKYMAERIRELIRDRRISPRDDGVSALVASRRADGTEFDQEDLVKVIALLIAGGVDTTTSLTGSTLIHLSRHPEQRRQLIESPDLLDRATDEFLRAFAPSQAMARTVTGDTEVGGCPMRRGDRVLIPWVSANHDPEVFPDPTEVRLDRDASRHVSFGIGSHRCVGAHLARAMFREMMTQVLTRLPDYQVIEEGLVGYPTSGSQTGWDAIPAVFTPGGLAAGRTLSGEPLTVTEVTAAADGVLSLRLSNGGPLPAWTPGSHLEVHLPSGRVRQYSLCGSPSDEDGWRIGVLREPAGRGGSEELHSLAAVGASFVVRGPRNHFPLVEARSYLFLAGGIGVTPILAMARAAAGADFQVVYGGRTRSSMAFVEELAEVAGDRLTLLPEDEAGRPDLHALVGAIGPDTLVYCCGPGPMIAAVEAACAAHGVADRLHVERFAVSEVDDFDPAENTAFEVHLARSGVTLQVPPERRLLEVVREAVSSLSYDCEKGYCGACETRVLAGVPEHRDSVLTDEERAAGRTMMICVGRSSSDRLVLDR